MPGRSHALLQEAGVNLVALMKEEGFYVERRIMSSPEATRGRGSFGEASPIELPTPHELSTYADKCALLLGCRLPNTRSSPLCKPKMLAPTRLAFP